MFRVLFRSYYNVPNTAKFHLRLRVTQGVHYINVHHTHSYSESLGGEILHRIDSSRSRNIESMGTNAFIPFSNV